MAQNLPGKFKAVSLLLGTINKQTNNTDVQKIRIKCGSRNQQEIIASLRHEMQTPKKNKFRQQKKR